MPTEITVEYDCANCCTYTIPTTLREDQSVLHQPALVDTLTAAADAQHDAECPTPAEVPA